ncbi:MAG: DinB family protein [Acidobacteria bacterium]|nr:DinB family protein [Acidobacteriota bacterium]MCA1642671.1 DinB family protein [Acidobacteriota bacterium]
MPETDGRDAALREHVLSLLRGGAAHVSFDDVVKDFPVQLANRKIAGVPYTPWQVLEHMRIALWDILEFSRDAAHVSPAWPEGYWPDKDLEAEGEAWRKSVEAFRADHKALEELIADPAADLYARIPHGTGQTLLREALLVADHNSYHLGVLVVLKRALETP